MCSIHGYFRLCESIVSSLSEGFCTQLSSGVGNDFQDKKLIFVSQSFACSGGVLGCSVIHVSLAPCSRRALAFFAHLFGWVVVIMGACTIIAEVPGLR